MSLKIPDDCAVVPRTANSAILARIPGSTTDQAAQTYERVIACAELHGPLPVQVSAFSCNQLATGGKRCDEWCRSPDTCVASYTILMPIGAWCGSLEKWWAQATDEQKKKAYAVSIDTDCWKAKRITELEDENERLRPLPPRLTMWTVPNDALLSTKSERMNKLEPSSTITTASGHGLQVGQAFTIHVQRPWWRRVWRWLTRQKDPVYFVTGVTDTVVNFKTPRPAK